MPLVNVTLIEVFTSAQRREIVRKLTDAVVGIEGENMQPVRTEDVKALGAGIDAR